MSSPSKMDTSLRWTVRAVPKMSVLEGVHCIVRKKGHRTLAHEPLRQSGSIIPAKNFVFNYNKVNVIIKYLPFSIPNESEIL